MAKKGKNIYLRKDGRYIKARKPDGRAVFGSVYGQRYEEVKRELTLLKAQQYQQGDIVSRAYQSATMREWSEYWLEVLTRLFVKQTTYELYRSKVQKWILPRLGECPLESITQSRLQVFVCELRSELSPNTARDVYRLLKALLRAAKDRGLIRNEPWSGVRSRGGQLNAQPRVLDLQEQQRFEQLCRARNMPEFLLALYTGLRIGELAALRVQDVDCEAGMLHVCHAAHRVQKSGEQGQKTHLVLGEPKNHASQRDVPLPAFLVDILRQQIRDMPKDAFLFPGRQGEMIDPRTLQARMKRITGELELQGVHCHTLRHTYATRCLEQKIGIEVLAELLGHSSPHITCQVYAHCTPQHKLEEVQKLHCLAG